MEISSEIVLRILVKSHACYTLIIHAKCTYDYWPLLILTSFLSTWYGAIYQRKPQCTQCRSLRYNNEIISTSLWPYSLHVNMYNVHCVCACVVHVRNVIVNRIRSKCCGFHCIARTWSCYHCDVSVSVCMFPFYGLEHGFDWNHCYFHCRCTW